MNRTRCGFAPVWRANTWTGPPGGAPLRQRRRVLTLKMIARRADPGLVAQDDHHRRIIDHPEPGLGDPQAQIDRLVAGPAVMIEPVEVGENGRSHQQESRRAEIHWTHEIRFRQQR